MATIGELGTQYIINTLKVKLPVDMFSEHYGDAYTLDNTILAGPRRSEMKAYILVTPSATIELENDTIRGGTSPSSYTYQWDIKVFVNMRDTEEERYRLIDFTNKVTIALVSLMGVDPAVAMECPGWLPIEVKGLSESSATTTTGNIRMTRRI